MNQTLKPRSVAPDAWKRWLKDGARLCRRTAPVLLPISLVVGLGLTCMAHVFLHGAWLFVLVAFLPVSGLWQAAFLHASERAAKGERIDVGTPFRGLLAFATSPRGQAWQQARTRLGVGLAFAVLSVSVVSLVFLMAQPDLERLSNASSEPTGWALAWALSDNWATIFLWVWVIQRGAMRAMANALVRGHGMDWTSAHALDDQNLATNRSAMLGMAGASLASIAALIVFPPLVFLLEVYWAAVLTVAYREIFLSRPSLAPQAARAGALAPALLRA